MLIRNGVCCGVLWKFCLSEITVDFLCGNWLRRGVVLGISQFLKFQLLVK